MKSLSTKITLADLILTGLTLVISIWFLFGLAGADSNVHPTLLVYENGQVIKEASLLNNQILNLDLVNGQIQVELDGKNGVRMLSSNCPAQICVHTGWINHSGQSIVCLPNKVLLELKGSLLKGNQQEYDAISY